MSAINKKIVPIVTAEGGKACHIPVDLQLRRTVAACLLFENNAYEDGVSIAERIVDLVQKNDPQFVANLAREARTKMKLRHVPLLLVRELARSKSNNKIKEVLSEIIQRPDELAEFLSIYWKDKKQPLSAQVKKGLAKAFQKFDSYALSKYNRDNAIKLRDVLFMVHAKPKDKEQEVLWKKLVDGTLESPDTWEVALSARKDKKETWERLLLENKLGALALVRNLRNMKEASVSEGLTKRALELMKVERVLPFRFIAAAIHAPQLEPELEAAMFKCVEGMEKLKGKTVLLVDVSGSMNTSLSSKSDMKDTDAANGLAILLREICESVSIYTFSNQIALVPPRRGFSLRDAINSSQEHRGTYLGQAIEAVNGIEKEFDRMIVITDEQSRDDVAQPKVKGYMINISTNKNGVGYHNWVHIDGFSESVISYIQEYEKLTENS